MIPATQLRAGMKIMHRGELCRVQEIEHITPGKGRGMVQAKLKNLKNNSNIEYRFRSDEKVEVIRVEEHEMEYLYSTGDEYYFMNTRTYEQIPLTEDLLGNAINYLVPNAIFTIEFFEGKPIGVNLPTTIDLKVIETEPPLKGATISGSPKPAKLETGVIVQVPPFIETGEIVRIDPSQNKYLERVKK
ncbi:elongation factor P [candidate division KSB1 bacterium]|nr:MAG: elongation factor P [candidate division KSB1 bacterium]